MKPSQMPPVPRTADVQGDTDETGRARFSPENKSCQVISQMLSRIGDKWSVLVVSHLGEGPMRFNEMRREIDNISQKMLTQTLRNLERDGFVSRAVTPTRPPSVEYALTDLGRELLIPVRALSAWTIGNIDRIEAARIAYDTRNPT